jgi:plasmid rolling circle replication initiator protein Rep
MGKDNSILCSNQENSINYIRKLKLFQQQIQSYYLHNSKRYERICKCGNLLALDHYQNASGDWLKKVKQAITCQLRFCPMCNHYRVINLTPQILRVMNDFANQDYDFVFMTFTVPNVLPCNLKKTIQKMNTSFAKMMKYKHFKQFKGWIRTLEITYNHNQEAHPHFHCIFVCQKGYFSRMNKLYINAKNGDLSRLWSKAFKSDQGLICDLRKINGKAIGKNSIRSAVAELAKYITKSADIKKLEKEWFAIVDEQLHGLRFIATSQNIKLDEDQETEISESEWQLIYTILYRWSREKSDYQETRTIMKNQ